MDNFKPSVNYVILTRASQMDNKGNSVSVLVLAIVFILAGFFLAVLTFTGTFAKSGLEFLSGFSMYIFGLIIVFTLVAIGFLLLLFVLRGS
jgi:hypothetical protein